MMLVTKALPLKRAVLAVLVILVTAGVTAGCNSMNLGNIDRTDDPRETMPGPGILDSEQEGDSLTWHSGKQKPAPAPVSTDATPTDEKAEFEQFKKWDNLRTNETESAEYQEFLEWLKYQKFKAGQ
jgi:hypothetical protein